MRVVIAGGHGQIALLLEKVLSERGALDLLGIRLLELVAVR